MKSSLTTKMKARQMIAAFDENDVLPVFTVSLSNDQYIKRTTGTMSTSIHNIILIALRITTRKSVNNYSLL